MSIIKEKIDPRKVTLMPGKLVVEINNNARMGNIITPDGVPQANNTGRIIHWAYKANGKIPDVNLPPGTQVGDYVLFQSRPLKHRSVPFESPFDFCDIIDDKDIMGVIRNGIMFPVGRKLLVVRLNDERRQGRLIIPGAQPTTDQSHWVKVLRKGLPKFHWRKLPKSMQKEMGVKRVWQLDQFKMRYDNFQPGVIAKLKSWKENMKEVAMAGGKYGLIIDEEDIAGYYPIDADPASMELD